MTMAEPSLRFNEAEAIKPRNLRRMFGGVVAHITLQ